MRVLTQDHLPQQLCPNCGEQTDATTGLTGGEPHEGAIVICVYCGAVLTLNYWLRLKLVKDVDALGLDEAERANLEIARRIAETYKQQHPRPARPKGGDVMVENGCRSRVRCGFCALVQYTSKERRSCVRCSRALPELNASDPLQALLEEGKNFAPQGIPLDTWIRATIGERVLLLCEYLHVSVLELANSVGMGKTTMYRLLNGTEINEGYMMLVAHRLGVSLECLKGTPNLQNLALPQPELGFYLRRLSPEQVGAVVLVARRMAEANEVTA